ncbi:MAG: hypothetical protein K2N06_01290 [Oscillospiraceae bacterium]|nr:hypothetical protein [Oscillospiraceae bacterium]
MNKFKRIGSAALAAALMAGTSITVNAETVYQGSNIGYNAYQWRNWSQPVTSYIEETDNGYMIVEAYAVKDKVAVRYYDSSNKFLSEKLVDTELPLFGAFYSDGSNYYILSGQNNPNQDNSCEVFRVTKYDKDWNRLSAASLYGENTCIPFDAGSARITHCENYLIVRTCHEMYKSSDGYNHQANVTFEVDTQSMTVTDKYTDVMNTNIGYVSHSFNQFLLVDEDNNLVTIDHGDANPRSVCLLKYKTDVSDGTFQADYFENPCEYVPMLPISGQYGNNYTGVTVGGFEQSNNSYIVAGTSINQDNSSSSTKNVFVSSIEKDLTSDSQPDIKYVTSIPEGDSSATNPFLVKLDSNSFMLIWSVDDTVYYTMLDENGHTTAQTKSFKGDLSDCQPILSGGYVQWYTRDKNDFKLYSINASDLTASVVSLSDSEPTPIDPDPVDPDPVDPDPVDPDPNPVDPDPIDPNPNPNPQKTVYTSPTLSLILNTAPTRRT